MYIYSVNVTIDKEIKDDWIKWMTEKHIPDVLRIGLLKDASVLVNTEYYADKFNFVVQYCADNQEDLALYREKYSPELQKEHSDRYEGKFSAKRNVFEIVKKY